MGPLDRMIMDAVRCIECGAKLGGCDCAEKRKKRFVDAEMERLLKLSDAELIAECEQLGITLER